MVQVKWTSQAKTDLKDIADYISIDSAKYAKFQVYKIITITKVLKSHSRIGKVVNEFDNQNIRELVYGNYRIIYKLMSLKRIDIVAIHHSARDLTKRIIE
ncbi:MAG: type II toxin-antitoxin system RelE/ParE family toxin [Draconibacterium sp.]|nr:type II toxin-antitoxin system RelE/ParE family toxin [Draconibacterium sp.]